MCAHTHTPVNTWAPTDTHNIVEERSIEHTLSMNLVPGSSRIDNAQLSPEAVDISREVEYAKQKSGSLPLLVNAVRGKLRVHYGCDTTRN